MTRDEFAALLGQGLTAARKAAGMSQLELAAALGCHKQTVYRWEAGEQVPDVWHWSLLLRVLPTLRLPRG